MATKRLELLRSMLEANPTGAFARYALAQELANTGDLEGAVEQYRLLLATDPAYSAAYFHGGQALEKLHRVEEAAALYRQGLEATTRNGDAHTHSEIQGALDLLPL